MTSQLHPGDRSSVLALMSPIIPHLYAGFEDATHKTREFFESQSSERLQKRDPYVAAHLTRFYAGDYLAGWGLDAHLDPIWLPNNGVALRHDVLDIRCVKADLGKVPGPGPSRTKRRFYNQIIQPGLFVFEPERERSDALVNVVVTWDVDRYGNLVSLEAHTPMYAVSSRESVRLYWTEPLMHPAESYEPEPPSEAEFDEPDDLPDYESDRPGEIADTGTE